MEHIHINPIKSGAICEIDLFGKVGLKNAIKKLNWQINRDRIIDSKGEIVKCSICGNSLKINNLSAFFPGSVKQVCEKPECFIGALYEIKQFE